MSGSTGEATAHDENGEPSPEDTLGQRRVTSLLRVSRVAAISSGVALLIGTVIALGLEKPAGLLLAAMAGAVLILLFSLWNMWNYSRALLRRLEEWASEVGGRYTLWVGGNGGYAGQPFAYGAEHERYGVVNYTVDGMPVEIGHLASQVSAQHRAPTGRNHPYALIRLPARLPHIILSTGHLGRVLGVRIMPDQWHRSQRYDAGFRRGRLYVAKGGEFLARTFFSPEIVRALERIGRHYDVEIKGRHLYLFPTRPVAAGSMRRWQRNRAELAELASELAAFRGWEQIRRQGHAHATVFTDMRADVRRAVTIFFSGAAVVTLVIVLIVLKAGGYFD